MKQLIFYYYLIKTSIKATMSNRGAFLFESAIMLNNNMIFLFLWWMFFREFRSIEGWQFADMIALIAIGTGSVGITQVFFGGVRNLSKLITGGDLDVFMTHPKNLLLQIAGSKSQSKGWGQIATACAMTFIGGYTSPFCLSVILIGIICGTLVFTSFSTIVHSMPFWMGSVEGVAKKYCDALYLFSNYPTNIYSGTLQLIMFTLIPAGIITFLPVELLRDFTWVRLLTLLLATATFVACAFFVFNTGLKRYESGNQLGLRA